MEVNVALDGPKQRDLIFYAGDDLSIVLKVYAHDGDADPIVVENVRFDAPAGTVPVGTPFTVPYNYIGRSPYRIVGDVSGITTTLVYGVLETPGGWPSAWCWGYEYGNYPYPPYGIVGKAENITVLDEHHNFSSPTSVEGALQELGDFKKTVGYINAAVPLRDYEVLRAFTDPVICIRITGVLGTSVPVGIAGTFQLDAADTQSIDNSGTTIVDVLGRRWKRVFQGPVRPEWFGALGDGTGALATDATPSPYDPRFLLGFDTADFVGIQRAIDFAGASGIRQVAIRAGNYILSKCVWVKHSNMRIEGAGKYATQLTQKKSLANWFEDLSDRGQLVIGGRGYGSGNYGTGRAWRNMGDGTFTTNYGNGNSFNFDIDNVTISGLSVNGDRTGFASGGQYMSSAGGPVVNNSALIQTGVMMLGNTARLAKGHVLENVFVSGHAKQGIAPCYLDGWTINFCTGTACSWQFVGTDYGCRNGLIVDCDAYDYADGTSENAFADFEAGTGVDYENITLLRCRAKSSVAGFLKLHPAVGRYVRNVLVKDCDADCAGAPSFGYLELFGPGTIDGVYFEGGTYINAAKHAFLFSTAGGQSNINISGLKKLTASAASTASQYLFYCREAISGLTIENNKNIQNGIQRFFMQDVGKLCTGLALRGNRGAMTSFATDFFFFYGSYFDGGLEISDNDFTFNTAAAITTIFHTNWRSSATEGIVKGPVKFLNNRVRGCMGTAANFWFTADDESNEVDARGNNLDGGGAATNYNINIRNYARRVVIGGNVLHINNGSAVVITKLGAVRCRVAAQANIFDIGSTAGPVTGITLSGQIDMSLPAGGNNVTIGGVFQ